MVYLFYAEALTTIPLPNTGLRIYLTALVVSPARGAKPVLEKVPAFWGETLKRHFAIIALSVCLSLWPGGVTADNAGSACENPDILTFSIIPTEETIQELTIYQPVIAYLARLTGKRIEFYMPLSYGNVTDAMIGKWVDIAVLGPYSYVMAKAEDPDIDVFATYVKQPGDIQEQGSGYRSVLITRKGTRYTSLAALREAAVALTDPASTSGNLIPRVLFAREVEMSLERFFGRVVYTGGHDLAALAVYEGRVAAAFVASHRFDNLITRGMLKKVDFNFLWSSPAVPLDPFCYRGSLCPVLKRKIKTAFLTLHEQPSCYRFLQKINASRLAPMADADYDIIRQLQKTADHTAERP